MNKKLYSVLRFFRLVDSDGTLSLTSIALIIVLYKLATAETVGVTELGSFFIAVLSYQGKKVINAQKPQEPNVLDSQVQEAVKKLEELDSKVSALALATGFKRP